MKKLINLTAIIFLISPCLTAQFSNQTFVVGSETRSYRQYLPTGFNAVTEPGLPLIIAMHGLGDNMTNFSNVGFDNIADTARFLVVYPQGTLNILSQTAWNNGTLLSSGSDDISFLSMLIDTMFVKYNVDLSKVYLTGFSMGGIMTYHMLCAMPSKIAAIASVSGPMADSDISTCNPGRSVPIMHMHGTADATVPYDSAALPSLSLVPATLSFWQNNNGCADSSIFNLPDLVADGITVDTIRFNSCGAPVIHWRENGADHQWLYKPVNDVDATTEIWLFFRDKIHPGPSQLGDEMVPSDGETNIRIIHDECFITSSFTIQKIMIYDLQGRLLVATEGKNQLEVTLNLGGLTGSAFIIQVAAEHQLTTRKIVSIR